MAFIGYNKFMKGNLLLVDDELTLIEAMKELLEEEASVIFTAKNGSEALCILERESISCIVSDIKMPVMDGIKFFHEAKKRDQNLPFIFFTGHGSDELREEVAHLGATDLLIKPNFNLLELAIRKAMLPTDRD